MYEAKQNVDEIFELCWDMIKNDERFEGVELMSDYMYMYSLKNEHYFKHINTRKFIKIKGQA
mgnify:CR=1 FL=1|tara:strand:- start:318 stop:503 length:186 start_codon:yes stop_codon:yes gene_type:complete